MKIISINSGSSSLKFKLLNMPEEKLFCLGSVEKIGYDDAIFNIEFKEQKIKKQLLVSDHYQAIQLILDALVENKIINSLQDIQAIGHRIVQGGEIFQNSVVLTDENICKIESLNDLAPLHNFANVLGIKLFKKILPKVLQVGVFDTTFHQEMPEQNFLYAVPYEWYRKYKLRKYGFHGISYQYVSQRVEQLLKKTNLKMIICHAGNGVSLAAIENGKSVDTSMGLTPLEGVPMGTRSGNIDPTAIFYIAKKADKNYKDILDILNKKSGMLGMSEVSNDARILEDKVMQRDKQSILAYEIQIKRIVDYIASYYVLLKGIDVLVFTAGIGENSSFFRQEIIKKLEVLNIYLDPELNKQKGEKVISSEMSSIKVMIVPTNEEITIVREVFALSKKTINVKNNN
ncbi:MAG: acetate kinase [Phytoplasma sp.]|uniref:acetate kinase n=1 Tax=Phytoplasma sp. TaxID=2155 RepID=UPI002B40B69C|nr:acetate kinase [Phytoplasma sp.]WRH06816.1 MAG: acetate kinase [Phytoplasma sp.]